MLLDLTVPETMPLPELSEPEHLPLGTGFDDFTADAHANAFEARPGVVCDLRRLLLR